MDKQNGITDQVQQLEIRSESKKRWRLYPEEGEEEPHIGFNTQMMMKNTAHGR